MGMKLAIDGGGTKLNMLLFDDEYNLISQGRSGGVNVTQTSLEDSRGNVDDCLSQIFSGMTDIHLDNVYAVFVGPTEILQEELRKHATVDEFQLFHEAEAGLLAGYMCDEGILAIAGTGSDVFYVRRDRTLNSVVGAWGPILGDQGSGTWIGQKALRSAVASSEGWGEPTIILDLIREEWELERDYDMVNRVHRSVAPFRTVASLTHLVGKAAHAGDKIALQILQDAGILMAVQTDCLVRRQDIPGEYQKVVCCGGAWKTHPSMFQIFKERLLQTYPDITVDKPWFEHVMAGIVWDMLKRDIPIEQGRQILDKKFPDYVINW